LRPSLAGRIHLSRLEGFSAGVVLILVLGIIHPEAHRSPTLRAAVESVATVFVLVGAGLMAGQFVHTRRLRDLLLFCTLVVLGLVEFVADALPAVLHVQSVGFASASPLGHLTVAAALVAAAVTPSDSLVVGGRRPIVFAVVVGAVCIGVAEVVGLLLGGQLLAPPYSGTGIDNSLQQPLGLVVALGTAGLFSFAANELARRSRLEDNESLLLFAGAAVLLAAAVLCYLAVPWASSEAITLREGFLLVAVALILAAALRQELDMRARSTRAAAIAERRRVAEDLHDGLAQDLAFIAAYGGRMAEELGGEHPVTVAARRALAISRHTISDLSDLSTAPPSDALEAIAQELRARFEIAISVGVHPDAELAPAARDHVARIAREAIANAARHGGAKNVIVSLRRTCSGVALRVCDDGRGITGPRPAVRADGFGLRNMRERAAALGGSLTVTQRRAGGTELEVVIPRCD
jgi:signal transduction histidine kinase